MLVILHCAHLKLATFAEYEECDRGKRTMVRMCGGKKYLAMLVCYSNNEQRTKWREESSWRHVFLYRTKLLQKQNSYTMRAAEKRENLLFLRDVIVISNNFLYLQNLASRLFRWILWFFLPTNLTPLVAVFYLCVTGFSFSPIVIIQLQCLLYARYSSLVCRICHSMRIMSDTFCITLQGEKLLKNNV